MTFKGGEPPLKVYRINFRPLPDHDDYEYVVADYFQTTPSGDVIFENKGPLVMFASGTWMSVVRTDKNVKDFL